MQTAFLRLPLAKKLLQDNLIAIVIVLSSALVFFVLIFSFMAQKNLRAASLYKATTLAANIGDNLSSTDLRQSNKLVLNVTTAPEVLSIEVFDRAGQPKISWNRLEYFGRAENLTAISPQSHAESSLHLGQLDVIVPIINGLESTGFVKMSVRLSPMYKDIALYFVLGFLLFIVATLACVYLLTQKQLLRLAPVFELSRIVEQVAVSEDYSLRARSHAGSELSGLGQHFNKIMSHIETWESDLQSEANQRLEEERRLTVLENHDSLTKLPNRHYFHRLLTNSVEQARESKQLAALAFIDIDQFRTINDMYGYDAGDLILATMANRLSAVLRNTDTLCRVDGDEFAAILPDIGSLEMAQTLAGRLVQAVQEPMILRGKRLVISASVGVACCPLHAKEQRLYLHNADLALKEAKMAGTNTWRIFSATTAQADAQLVLQVDI